MAKSKKNKIENNQILGEHQIDQITRLAVIENLGKKVKIVYRYVTMSVGYLLYAADKSPNKFTNTKKMKSHFWKCDLTDFESIWEFWELENNSIASSMCKADVSTKFCFWHI